MNLKPALLAALVLTCAACGTSSDTEGGAASATSAPTSVPSASNAPLDEAAANEYETKLLDKLKACPYVNISADYSTACLIGVEKAIDLLEEFDKRTPMTLPKTRAATITAIEDLEFWRDTCPAEVVKAADRKTCVLKTPIPGNAAEPMWVWFEETGRRN